MVIASYDFSVEEVVKIYDSGKSISDLIYSRTPDMLKHIECINSNTRYYIATELIYKSDLVLKRKKEISNWLMSNLHVVGVIDEYVDCIYLLQLIDLRKVDKYGLQ